MKKSSVPVGGKATGTVLALPGVMTRSSSNITYAKSPTPSASGLDWSRATRTRAPGVLEWLFRSTAVVMPRRAATSAPPRNPMYRPPSFTQSVRARFPTLPRA